MTIPAFRTRAFAPRGRSLALVVLAIALAARSAIAQSPNAVVIDATRPIAPPETGFLRMGTSVAPGGARLGVNSRYLTRDGRPWLPVMGEFHFSRYPERYWEEELLKMKAGGVQIVATYVFWIHHEEIEGTFDWSGQRDLRRFVQLAGRHGIYVLVRIGPWSHGESRNGGFPDWLMHKGLALRSNDPRYLEYVRRYYDEIGRQLHGLLWKDGGPVLGVQLENEYTARGSGRGPEHILRLKELARAAGLDVPLYTVTGWDGATLPAREVVPVFGGYPDAPWDASIGQLPPNEVYAFRFANRAGGNMGTQGFRAAGTTQDTLAHYPFFGAEFAGGIEDTYHRRPVIAPDDIAAMLPVQLGSGVDLYGYYMFHGGTNPPGKLTTLQESQRSGYPTDVPVKSYDFQAPLGEFGRMRESFRRIRLVHSFLRDFGELLAPMVTRAPERVPASPADTSVPRVAARTDGTHAFVFFNDYVRDHPLPARHGLQVTLRLPRETLAIPRRPIDLPSGAYGIWPVELDLGGATLVYSTAQLFARVSDDLGPVYFFFEIPGIAPELALDSAGVASLEAPGASVDRGDGRIYVHDLRTSTTPVVTIHPRAGRPVRVVVLTRAQAENAWRLDLAGRERMLLSPQQLFVNGDELHLRAEGPPRFSFAVFPALASTPRSRAPLRRAGKDGLFTRYTAELPAKRIALRQVELRRAAPAPPVQRMNAVTWRKDSVAVPPEDSAFARAAAWRLTLPPHALDGLSDLYLRFDFAGDIARLYSGDALLDDDFFNGTPWMVGLKRFASELARGPLTLRILPLRQDAPVYIPVGRPDFAGRRQVAELRGIRVVPEYELVVRP